MRKWVISLLALALLGGCGKWGGFSYKSDRFKFKTTFPDYWEVWDRSSDASDFLVGTLPDAVPGGEIIVRAIPVAPDISPNEIYPSFLDGSDYGDRLEFAIEDRGTISCSNSDGRFIKYHYRKDNEKRRGMKVIFLGNRVIIEVSMEMPEDAFIMHESDFTKMIHLMEL